MNAYHLILSMEMSNQFSSSQVQKRWTISLSHFIIEYFVYNLILTNFDRHLNIIYSFDLIL